MNYYYHSGTFPHFPSFWCLSGAEGHLKGCTSDGALTRPHSNKYVLPDPHCGVKQGGLVTGNEANLSFPKRRAADIVKAADLQW